MHIVGGFLGTPEDWNFLGKEGEDLWAGEWEDFWSWARNFNRRAEGGILLGYSLGGRLAMHALLDSPQIWKGAIFVSAHPGLPLEERAKRIQSDERWAERFLKDSWDILMRDWNAQEVLASSRSLLRREEEYDRKRLADALRGWSLGRQENLRDRLTALQIPILWIGGENDRHFQTIELAHPHSYIWIAPGAGHRVPWDVPAKFTQVIHNFKEEIL